MQAYVDLQAEHRNDLQERERRVNGRECSLQVEVTMLYQNRDA